MLLHGTSAASGGECDPERFNGETELLIGGHNDLDDEARDQTPSAEVTRWLRQNAPHVEIYPQLTSRLTASETAAVLARSESRSRLIEELADYLHQNSFQGV